MSKLYLNKHEFFIEFFKNEFYDNTDMKVINKLISLFRKNEFKSLLKSYSDFGYFIYRKLDNSENSKDIINNFNPSTARHSGYLTTALKQIIQNATYVNNIVSDSNEFRELQLKYQDNLREINKEIERRVSDKNKRKKKWALTVLQYSNMPDWAKEYLSK